MNYRIIVISDTHGSFSTLKSIIDHWKNEAFCFIHLGDGCKEIDDIKILYPDITLYAVRGNCDNDVTLPAYLDIKIGGKTIFMTHGDGFDVKYNLDTLKRYARNFNADIALYGHTHIGYTEYDNGLYILNPGSARLPRDFKKSYGVLDITDAGIVTNIVQL